jgi:hypothetical protein
LAYQARFAEHQLAAARVKIDRAALVSLVGTGI